MRGARRSARRALTRLLRAAEHFGERPVTSLRAHLTGLAGVEAVELVTDDVTEAWIDFRYRGHQFSANTQLGAWWLFVTDPACPAEILEAVVEHCRKLLRV